VLIVARTRLGEEGWIETRFLRTMLKRIKNLTVLPESQRVVRATMTITVGKDCFNHLRPRMRASLELTVGLHTTSLQREMTVAHRVTRPTASLQAQRRMRCGSRG